MDNTNFRFDGLEALINKMNIERPTMNVPTIKNKKTQVFEEIKENTEDIFDSNNNQFWKNLLISIIGSAIGGIISYLLTLI